MRAGRVRTPPSSPRSVDADLVGPAGSRSQRSGLSSQRVGFVPSASDRCRLIERQAPLPGSECHPASHSGVAGSSPARGWLHAALAVAGDTFERAYSSIGHQPADRAPADPRPRPEKPENLALGRAFRNGARRSRSHLWRRTARRLRHAESAGPRGRAAASVPSAGPSRRRQFTLIEWCRATAPMRGWAMIPIRCGEVACLDRPLLQRTGGSDEPA